MGANQSTALQTSGPGLMTAGGWEELCDLQPGQQNPYRPPGVFMQYFGGTYGVVKMQQFEIQSYLVKCSVALRKLELNTKLMEEKVDRQRQATEAFGQAAVDHASSLAMEALAKGAESEEQVTREVMRDSNLQHVLMQHEHAQNRLVLLEQNLADGRAEAQNLRSLGDFNHTHMHTISAKLEAQELIADHVRMSRMHNRTLDITDRIAKKAATGMASMGDVQDRITETSRKTTNTAKGRLALTRMHTPAVASSGASLSDQVARAVAEACRQAQADKNQREQQQATLVAAQPSIPIGLQLHGRVQMPQGPQAVGGFNSG